MFLPVYPYDPTKNVDPDLPTFFNTPNTPTLDICPYLGSQAQGQAVTKLYFDPIKFPPIFNGSLTLSKTDDATLKELKSMITTAAASASSPVSIAHTCKSGKHFKRSSDFFQRFACKVSNSNNNKRRKTKTKTPITGEENTPNLCTPVVQTSDTFRKTTPVINDRGNGRRHGIGKGAPGQPRKRSKRVRVCNCTFAFTLRVDEYGFYINTKHCSGNAEHIGHHPKSDPKFVPTQIMSSLTREEQEGAIIATKSTVNKT